MVLSELFVEGLSNFYFILQIHLLPSLPGLVHQRLDLKI